MWREIFSKIREFVSKIRNLVADKIEDYLSGDTSIRRKEYNSSNEKVSRAVHEENEVKARQEVKYTPKSMEDFVDLIRRTPKTVLSKDDRTRIAAVMSFEDRTVSELMTPREKMVFVNEKDLLGPLMLDKLYKSGFTNFPVVNKNDKVVGVIHTEALNALEIKKTDRAEKYMDEKVFSLHATDSLAFAVSEIERTNAYYFFVFDGEEKLVGFFTVGMLLEYLVG